MHWYKHSTDSHDDPDISDAMDEFGPSGYSGFFILLEIYGREFNSLDEDGYLTLSRRFVARKLRQSSTKVESMLNFYSERQRILVKSSPKRISFKVPQFIEIASNWTKRKPVVPTEALQRPSAVPTAREVEVEEEVEKKPKKNVAVVNSYSQQFLDFYQIYPNKTAKAEAFKAWKKIDGKGELLPTILQSIKDQTAHKARLRERDEFCPEWPNPSTWLNQARWEDEVKESKKESLAEYEKRMSAT